MWIPGLRVFWFRRSGWCLTTTWDSWLRWPTGHLIRKDSFNWKKQRSVKIDQGERPSFFCKNTEILPGTQQTLHTRFLPGPAPQWLQAWPLLLLFSLMLSAHLNSLLSTTCLQVDRPSGLWPVTPFTVSQLFPQSSHQHLCLWFQIPEGEFNSHNVPPEAQLHK